MIKARKTKISAEAATSPAPTTVAGLAAPKAIRQECHGALSPAVESGSCTSQDAHSLRVKTPI
nr:hypothetical protein [Candidatus Sigynarchaeota archaeon]